MACESSFSEATFDGLHYQVNILSLQYRLSFYDTSSHYPNIHYSVSHLVSIFTKVLEIELDDDSYKGMPFVLRSNETWIQNNAADFYLDFSRRLTKGTEVTLSS
jgi:hypothetical protein